MRVAISSEGDQGLESIVSHHFGRCPYFTIVDIEDQKASSVEVGRGNILAYTVFQDTEGRVPRDRHDGEVDRLGDVKQRGVVLHPQGPDFLNGIRVDLDRVELATEVDFAA